MRRFADTGDNTTTNTASKTAIATQTALPSRSHWVRFLKLLCVKKCLRRISEGQSPTVGLRVFAVSRRWSWRPNCKPDSVVRTRLLIKTAWESRKTPPLPMLVFVAGLMGGGGTERERLWILKPVCLHAGQELKNSHHFCSASWCSPFPALLPKRGEVRGLPGRPYPLIYVFKKK